MSELEGIRKAVVNGADAIMKAAEQYERDAGVVDEGLKMIADGIVRVLQGRQMASSAAETVTDGYTDIAFALAGSDKPGPIKALSSIFAALQVMQAQNERLHGLEPYLDMFNKSNDLTETPHVMATTAREVELNGEILRTHGLMM